MSEPRLVVATANPHKVDELRAILAPLVAGFDPAHVAGLDRFGATPPIEDGITFADNALIKARAAARATGLPAIADDSGLCVDVLGGAPGIFSARWSGRHGDDRANLDLLLAQLRDIRPPNRGARFVCAAALVVPGGREITRTGEVRGRLLDHRVGAGGFGYDPIFVPEGSERTTAQMSPAQKNAISHRGRAFRALAPHVARALAARAQGPQLRGAPGGAHSA